MTGIALCAAGLVLLLDLFGAARAVIDRVTSRSLGELAPGYAASRTGLRVYAVLVVAVGALAVGIALENAVLLLLGAVTFIAASAAALAGEVKTYRGLKR